ncbi:neuronal acetylcholine receptor subunit alpha-7 [Elysia marginata]|uniref:Neuronal acetylcholine receptor subunit alpha-7 n=1 Tax=Elysia marginata TaxID=1093978 RepID=A0AAV4JZT1_9GAST|nr:neuronal acetylcholine receptor subunit alpha-7 [Elysia marginata]
MEHPTRLERSVSNGQFVIEVAEPLLTVTAFDGLDYDFVHFQIRLLRRPFYTFLSMLLPMFVIGLLNVVSFMIPSDSGEKVSVSLNILLATAVFIGVVHDDLPDRSDTISSVGT